ncbi:MAG: hypothetical protein FJW86_12150 [Actinobacteria bacterium]|nr:hypothetical protein [Actinomycetota bacterium]
MPEGTIVTVDTFGTHRAGDDKGHDQAGLELEQQVGAPQGGRPDVGPPIAGTLDQIGPSISGTQAGR